MGDSACWVKILLFTSCLFCLGVIFFDIGLIPPVFGYSENAESINKALLNISYSYFAGFLFAILTIYIPKRIETRKSLRKVQNSLIALLKELSWCEGALSFIDNDNQRHGISNNTAIGLNSSSTTIKLEYITLSLIDPNKDTELSNIDVIENTWYTKSTYYGINGKIIITYEEYVNVVSDINKITTQIDKIITNIKMSSHYKDLPSKLINLLDSINSDALFYEAKCLHEAVKKKLIIAENFSYNHSNLPSYIDSLIRYVSSNSVWAKVTFTNLDGYECSQYQAYLSQQIKNGDMYRQISGIGRIYDGTYRI